eukprot:SAG11_NODE_8650_length_991_cov_0.995516_2_plen_152_part_00
MSARTEALEKLLAARERVQGVRDRGGDADDLAALETVVARLSNKLIDIEKQTRKNAKAAAKTASTAKKPAAAKTSKPSAKPSAQKGKQQQAAAAAVKTNKGKGKGTGNIQGRGGKGRGKGKPSGGRGSVRSTVSKPGAQKAKMKGKNKKKK